MFKTALKITGLLMLCFTLGFSGVATANAYWIITAPLKPAVAEPSPVDAKSICTIAQSVGKITHCIAAREIKTITFNMEATGADALKACQKIAAMSTGFGVNGWTLAVYSAYQFNPIAKCR